ncbi:unnamed protein product [Adineta ricciae]|uniref:Uncharacterized protein n=1 Tax=Adineta ricciae TaxID=249248 RepID=A0A814WJH6_ADIRI|nr:unnamed protein product [Adineta ricciae]CAF1203206.1 unnamed protein product [Adineta ricciae]
MIDYEFYYEQYRREPRRSTATQKDLLDYHSAISTATSNNWSQPVKRSLATTCIDGSKLPSTYENPYQVKDSFPKGKFRRKPLVAYEKKSREATSIIDSRPVASEKSRTSLSMTPNRPDMTQSKSTPSRISSAFVYDEKDSTAKLYGRRATAHANGWVRRYKSVNQSHVITNFLHDLERHQKHFFRKRTCQPQPSPFSPSSSASSFDLDLLLNKRRRKKC